MDVKTFELLARYNVWATKKLNESLEQVTDEDFNKECGLYFNSILGTLNHLLVGEHELWFRRFTNQISATFALNAIIETNKNQLLKKLEIGSQAWIAFIDQLDTKKFNQSLTYKTSKGQKMCLPYAATLLHVFNHGTHHRGQITAALTCMGYSCPALDLVYMLVEEKQIFLE